MHSSVKVLSTAELHTEKGYSGKFYHVCILSQLNAF